MAATAFKTSEISREKCSQILIMFIFHLRRAQKGQQQRHYFCFVVCFESSACARARTAVQARGAARRGVIWRKIS